MSGQVHLVQMMPDEDKVMSWSAEHRFLRSDDIGYGLHGLLGAAFGDKAPGSYLWLPSLRGFRKPHLLAYSQHPAAELRDHAGFFGDPDAMEALGVDGAASKAIPAFRAGMRLCVEVRTLPVTRTTIEEGDRRRHVERDAYLHARTKASEQGLSRTSSTGTRSTASGSSAGSPTSAPTCRRAGSRRAGRSGPSGAPGRRVPTGRTCGRSPFRRSPSTRTSRSWTRRPSGRR